MEHYTALDLTCVAYPDRTGESPLRPGLQADRQRHAGQHPGPAGAGGVQGDTCPAAGARDLTRVCAGCEGGADRRGARHRHEQTLPTRQQVQVSDM